MNDANEGGQGIATHDPGEADGNGEGAPAKTILVVDDELFGMRKAHVAHVAASFYETIVDVNDPVFANLWDVAKAIPSLEASGWDVDTAAAYLSSDAAVSTVLLSDQFQQVAQVPLRQLVAPFIARAVRVSALKKAFVDAFPPPVFDLQFAGPPRPDLARVLQCTAVFLDLFLEQGEGPPIEAVQDYLRQLAADAGETPLPPLVLMSSHPEIKDQKLRFSERAGISAAGLLILPKATLMEPEFGARGLELAVKQLERQKNVAHAMRLFVAAWLGALEEAKRKTAATLWNLDASAMQQIHYASASDADPYDEHVNELLSREHLFHVESESGVAARIAELDKEFRAQLGSAGEIENRLIAPLSDVETARSFMSHFTWFGSASPGTFISDEQDAATRISRTLPFGSVLCRGEPVDGSTCLVHITQQCDLNGISRSKNALRTLVFVAAEARELESSDNPIVETTDLVAKGLRLKRDGHTVEFDLKLKVGELAALPLRDFLEKSRIEEWRVVGRLRSDITNHIVAACTNQMSRPASQKMIRPALLRSKVFLQAAAFEGGKTSLLDKSFQGAQPRGKIFSLSRDDGRYSFQDDACIEIALWIAHHSTQIGVNIDPDAVSAALRRGWPSPGELPGGLKIRVRQCKSLNAAWQGLTGGDVGGASAQFTVIVEG